MKPRTKYFAVAAFIFLSGCAVNKVTETRNGEVLAAVRDVNYMVAKNKAIESAHRYCATRGRGVNYLRADQPYDNVGAAYYLYFNCYDLAAAQEQERLRREAQRQEEERQRAIAAENARQAEIERKRREAEWERQRPQREAEARRQQQAEKRRLDGICPFYWFARQTCATAANYESCMTVRMSNKYSRWDDQKCFNR